MTGNNRGQVMPYFLVMLLVLVICWALLINAAKLMKDRMVMQNAADNAALSVAVLRARTLNFLGALNYLTATTLSAGAYPCLVPVPLCNADYVGGSISSIPFPFCDVRCNYGSMEYHEDYSGVKRLRFTVETLQKLQLLLVNGYKVNSIRVGQEIARRQEMNSRGEYTAADIGAVVQASLGVKRNERGITYYKTANIGATPTRHYHVVWPRKWRRERYSWYTADRNFYRQKIDVVAVKRSGSASNAGYPLFGGAFGMRAWPTVTAKASAAVYDTGGAMLPETDDVWTGIPAFFLPKVVLDNSLQVAKMYETAAEVSAIPYIGTVLGAGMYTAATGVALISEAAIIKATVDRETPVRRYEDAEYGGWDAHLVPARSQ